MIDLRTGLKLRSGEEVCLGDKIQGKSTHPMTVKHDSKGNKFVCVIENYDGMDFTGITHDLDDIINSWSDLKVIGNINLY